MRTDDPAHRPGRHGAVPLRRAAHPSGVPTGERGGADDLQHVYEVDPRLMQEHVLQQVFPNGDTLRIMRSGQDHLAWMHRHFAEGVVTGSDVLTEVEAEAQLRNPQGSAPVTGSIDDPTAR